MNTQKEINFGNGVKIIAKEDPVKKLKKDLILLYKLDYDMNDIFLTIEKFIEKLPE